MTRCVQDRKRQRGRVMGLNAALDHSDRADHVQHSSVRRPQEQQQDCDRAKDINSPVTEQHAVQVPTPPQLFDIAEEIGLDLSTADAISYIELLRPYVGAYNVLAAMTDHLPPVRYPRETGYRPSG